MSATSETVPGDETALRDTVAALTHRVGTLEAQQAVRTLHHQYGYYLDKCLYREVVDLFAEDCEVYFCGGLYKGKQGVRRLYIEVFANNFVGGGNGPIPGFLLDHVQMQDVVTIAEDLKTARARFRTLMQAGVHHSVKDGSRSEGIMDQWWEGGLYENRYVNEDGVWKIAHLEYRPFWHGEYDKGWANTEPLNGVLPTVTYPQNPLGPDEIPGNFALFPNTDVVPFHYPHPVTGQPYQAG